MAPEVAGNETRFGKYRILERLGIGGVGTVYKAVDVDLDRVVALKLLAKRFADRPEVIARFRSEARSAAKLQHENIVGVYEFGEVNATHYLAMEYVDGVDLHEYVRKKRQLTPAEGLHFLSQAARALDHAHQQGLIHRDIKPPNFLVTKHQNKPLLKLTDFGLARVAHDRELNVTGDGLTVGTVDYISPEQARNSRLSDIRSDLYSLGCTFFFMLAGRPPFPTGSAAERLMQHINGRVPDVRDFNPAVPLVVANVARRLMAKKPDDRYQRPKDLLFELEDIGSPMAATPGRSASAQTPTGDSSGDSSTDLSLKTVRVSDLSIDDRRKCDSLYQKAMQLNSRGEHAAAVKALRECSQKDPGNLGYRQALRRATKILQVEHGGSWIGSLFGGLRWKAKVRSAKRRGKHKLVLSFGEEVLRRNPKDIGVILTMADAAEKLKYGDVAAWILASGIQENPRHPKLCRALAFLSERQENLSQAITMWKLIRSFSPEDAEARQKLKDLSARQTIVRGNYRSRVGDDQVES